MSFTIICKYWLYVFHINNRTGEVFFSYQQKLYINEEYALQILLHDWHCFLGIGILSFSLLLRYLFSMFGTGAGTSSEIPRNIIYL